MKHPAEASVEISPISGKDTNSARDKPSGDVTANESVRTHCERDTVLENRHGTVCQINCRRLSYHKKRQKSMSFVVGGEIEVQGADRRCLSGPRCRDIGITVKKVRRIVLLLELKQPVVISTKQ